MKSRHLRPTLFIAVIIAILIFWQSPLQEHCGYSYDCLEYCYAKGLCSYKRPESYRTSIQDSIHCSKFPHVVYLDGAGKMDESTLLNFVMEFGKHNQGREIYISLDRNPSDDDILTDYYRFIHFYYRVVGDEVIVFSKSFSEG